MKRTLLLAAFSLNSYAYDGVYNDAEIHFVDYFQRTNGVSALIEVMDKSNINHAFLMGMPVKKKWSSFDEAEPDFVFGDDSPVYYYSYTDSILVNHLSKSKYQNRLHPFITGFNPTDLFAAEHIEELLRSNPGFWKGIGEILTRHDTLSKLTLGEQSRANHPALMKVYKVAAKYNLPVILHSNITSEREKSPLYKSELEEVLVKNRKTKFIWAHGGSSSTLLKSQRLDFLIDEARDLLEENDNLYILASWTLLDIIVKDAKSKEEWLALITDYPERFMIGSDVVGKFKNTGKLLSKWDEVLDLLPKDIANKMAEKNMLSMINIAE
ncbi:MAG: amidohydrolase family protein [Moritella sp.]|uniref:amidohydrolase family protein n=1 Tax=Moritella sp. TaxID=78556 RepID=UPI0029B96B98|nr:amidohydrolase family protein [Moritella sp.]MDX2319490.1 amidohydrolase family protein [Moritella sp.]